MDALSVLLDLLKKEPKVRGHLLGILHILIGRRITTAEGQVVSQGLPWRDLAARLKKVRWDPEEVRDLGMDPDELPPRDRQRFWYLAISRAQVDSAAANKAGDQVGEILSELGYNVGPSPRR
jgi:hypothetical protein